MLPHTNSTSQIPPPNLSPQESPLTIAELNIPPGGDGVILVSSVKIPFSYNLSSLFSYVSASTAVLITNILSIFIKART